ncbi:MAG: UDP-N-acetylglucosamine--N-acetylmuramyl-(pentapeptide) pyrophosphoryl-undecaprenol N-acetylglucosamine transferase, partial [Clostridia bacterium]|nr:UDP-N-acetylglucosamine--N-acetylmuramyl-(pentapeptide) pyrophosphoryl-undecaprenol N-acetylglucosamine transferase [Clostridia bacterium]
MMYKIVFTGGGTAGHVVPNIAVMQKTNKYFDKTYYFGSDSGIEKSLITPLDIPFYSVPCVKFSRDNFLKNLKIPFSLMS